MTVIIHECCDLIQCFDALTKAQLRFMICNEYKHILQRFHLFFIFSFFRIVYLSYSHRRRNRGGGRGPKQRVATCSQWRRGSHVYACTTYLDDCNVMLLLGKTHLKYNLIAQMWPKYASPLPQCKDEVPLFVPSVKKCQFFAVILQ